MRSLIVGLLLAIGLVVGVYLVLNTNDEQENGVVSPVPTSVVDQTSTPLTSPVEETVTISLVSLEDAADMGDTFGCGDSIISVQEDVVVDGDSSVEEALTALFAFQSNASPEGEELYNALAQSDLDVDRVETDNGRIEVYLTGNLSIGGTCDSPRIEEQLTKTVEDNSTANTIEIYINDETLDEVLSTR